MKLSELITQAEHLKSMFGDVDLLDSEDFPILSLQHEKAAKGQLEFWGMDTSEDYYFVRVYSSK
jgi:hypothetical protein